MRKIRLDKGGANRYSERPFENLREEIMFAIIKTGGKQHRVSSGDTLLIEKLKPEEGKNVEFKDVLLVADGKKVLIGQPIVDNAVVLGEVESEAKGEKLYPFKKKRRKKYRRLIGHRQKLSVVKIKEIKIK